MRSIFIREFVNNFWFWIWKKCPGWILYFVKWRNTGDSSKHATVNFSFSSPNPPPPPSSLWWLLNYRYCTPRPRYHSHWVGKRRRRLLALLLHYIYIKNNNFLFFFFLLKKQLLRYGEPVPPYLLFLSGFLFPFTRNISTVSKSKIICCFF